MQEQKYQINVAPGAETVEVIVREVNTVNELAVKAPIKIGLVGVIGAPYEFLLKRMSCEDQVNQKRSHILVNREKISIELIINENDEYLKGSVKGILAMHPKFIEFGINTGKTWTPTELGLFFKMNRAFFSDRATNMELVTTLMNFTAKVQNSIERSVKESGDRTDNFVQHVESNLPKSFNLTIPIFKGIGAEILEVETFAQVNGREVSFTLLSPAANQTVEDIRDSAIDDQLKAIGNLCPDIAIIEQ
jgi:hypothetical protein